MRSTCHMNTMTQCDEKARLRQPQIPRYSLKGVSFQNRSQSLSLLVPVLFFPVFQKPSTDRRIGIDAPVAQKGPVATRIFFQRQVDLADQNLFLLV